MPLSEGHLAPDFTLERNGGETVTLSALRGRPVVDYFYPADDTPGCTIEAKDFSALKPSFDKLGVEIIGISPDSVAKHDKFCDKYGLTIPLAADPDHRTAEAFGAFAEKSLFGRRFLGVLRNTYLIDRRGHVARIWSKVKVDGHAEEVLAAASEL